MKLWEVREAMQRWVNNTELLDQDMDVSKLVGHELHPTERLDFYPIDKDGVEAEYTNDIKGVVLVV